MQRSETRAQTPIPEMVGAAPVLALHGWGSAFQAETMSGWCRPGAVCPKGKKQSFKGGLDAKIGATEKLFRQQPCAV